MKLYVHDVTVDDHDEIQALSGFQIIERNKTKLKSGNTTHSMQDTQLYNEQRIVGICAVPINGYAQYECFQFVIASLV